MFSAAQMVVEEFLVRGCEPSLVVGMEGAYGIVYMVVLLSILQSLPGEFNLLSLRLS